MATGAGWYYLHTNGDLIYKPSAVGRPEVEPGGFVRKVWPIDTERRETAWLLCIEAWALGARRDRVDELAAKWGLTDEDAQAFVAHATDKAGQPVFRLFLDGTHWCATFHDFVDLQASQCGFGATALEALAELAKPGLLAKYELAPQ